MIKRDDIAKHEVNQANIAIKKLPCPCCKQTSLEIVLINSIYRVYCNNCHDINYLKYKTHCNNPNSVNYNPYGLQNYESSHCVTVEELLRLKKQYTTEKFRLYCISYGIPSQKLDDLT